MDKWKTTENMDVSKNKGRERFKKKKRQITNKQKHL